MYMHGLNESSFLTRCLNLLISLVQVGTAVASAAGSVVVGATGGTVGGTLGGSSGGGLSSSSSSSGSGGACIQLIGHVQFLNVVGQVSLHAIVCACVSEGAQAYACIQNTSNSRYTHR